MPSFPVVVQYLISSNNHNVPMCSVYVSGYGGSLALNYIVKHMNQMPEIKIWEPERWHLGFLNITEHKFKASKLFSPQSVFYLVNTFRSLK